ncbi:MAG TPA: sulfur carrier protein ThiS [Longimicrobiales bacterium]|nr:sulfur carrier protein ThiS [Longimicrobiales bacterium]
MSTTTSSIEITLNGRQRSVPEGLTLTGLLEHIDIHPRMVVVEWNREIIRHEHYSEIVVRDGDVIELVHFVGGG